MKIKVSQIPLLIFSIILPLSAGIIGSIFTFSAIPNWYAGLVKPPISPPNWVFGPVWTTLYILMGIAFFIVATKKESNKTKSAKSYFYFQLALNALWSFAFFGLKSPLAGLFVIIPLFILIFITVDKFSNISRKAFILMLPYLGWVGFASILNLWILILNS